MFSIDLNIDMCSIVHQRDLHSFRQQLKSRDGRVFVKSLAALPQKNTSTPPAKFTSNQVLQKYCTPPIRSKNQQPHIPDVKKLCSGSLQPWCHTYCFLQHLATKRREKEENKAIYFLNSSKLTLMHRDTAKIIEADKSTSQNFQTIFT